MTYNMQAYLEKSIERYLAVLPPGSALKKASTPFLTAADPRVVSCPSHTEGATRVCPWCQGCSRKVLFSLVVLAPVRPTRRATRASRLNPWLRMNARLRVVLWKKAASVLIQLLCAARYTRFGILCAMAKLAQRNATWDEDCDKGIYRLMCYIQSTL